MANKLLILGASGYVGQAIVARLGPEKCLATYCRRPIPGAVRFDARSMDLADAVDGRPDAFSHAVILYAEKNPEACVADPAGSHALNVDSVARVLARLREWNVVPVFASSEFVFAGGKERHTEDDIAAPVLVYGRQKLAVEQLIQQSFDRHLILRLAKVFGSQSGDGTLFTRWKDAIARGETIRCAVDQVFSPVYVDDVVNAVVGLIAREASGLYHVSSGHVASRLEYLEMLLAEMRKHRPVDARIERCRLHECGLTEPWPLRVALDPSKLVHDTRIQLTDPRDACREIAKVAMQGATG